MGSCMQKRAISQKLRQNKFQTPQDQCHQDQPLLQKKEQTKNSLHDDEDHHSQTKPWYYFLKSKINTLFALNLATSEKESIELDISMFAKTFPVSLFSLCIYSNQTLFITGGNDSEFNELDSHFHLIFNSENDFSDYLLENQHSLIMARSGHAIAPILNYLYAVGGMHIYECEKFDIQKNEWTELPSLNDLKYSCALANIDDKILFAIGEMLHPFEKLSLTHQNSSWEIVEIQNSNLWSNRNAPQAISIGKHQILIFGGVEKSDSFLFNYQKNALEKNSELPNQVGFCDPFVLPIRYNEYIYSFAKTGIYIYSLKRGNWKFREEKNWLQYDPERDASDFE